MRIALVVGEASGDRLGAGLIQALRQQEPDITCYGVTGPHMRAQGCDTLFDAQELAVMGFIEPIKVLPRLWRRFHEVVQHLIDQPPDVLVTIDAPDFSLRLAKALKKKGLKCPKVHYVSPSVWAWRQGRLHTLQACFDEVLTLFPFEQAFYQRYHVPATCVGHPMAQNTPCVTQDQRHLLLQQARQALKLPADTPVVALLPGSRTQELKRMWPLFWEAFAQLKAHTPTAMAIVLTPHAKAEAWFDEWEAQHPEALAARQGAHPTWKRYAQGSTGTTEQVLQAADVALTTSGTVTLEAMIHQCPMVVAYVMNPLVCFLAKRWVRLEHFSLPNILTGRAMVPEYLQKEATPEHVAQAALHWLNNPQGHTDAFREEAQIVHQSLQQGGSALAAERVLWHARHQHEPHHAL